MISGVIKCMKLWKTKELRENQTDQVGTEREREREKRDCRPAKEVLQVKLLQLTASILLPLAERGGEHNQQTETADMHSTHNISATARTGEGRYNK